MALETNDEEQSLSPLEPETQLAELQREIQEFCEVRDWDQFHGPKDLAIGLVTESSELLDLFRFKSDEESLALVNSNTTREKIEDELADVFFFTLRFAQKNGIDLVQALRAKIAKNGKKYPVELSRGSNRKYTEF